MEMALQGQFICGQKEYCRLYQHVNAPYIRKAFLTPQFQKAGLYICGLGFYDAYINGKRITKGKMAPYISNPDHIFYYDCYDITDLLQNGENVFGAILGNGNLNNMGAFPWNNDDTPYRSSPKLSMAIVLDGKVFLSSDTSFKWAPSPITFDDIRCGEYYDARLEQPGWNEPGFDDSAWQNVICAESPKGEPQICKAEPIKSIKEIYPISKTVSDGRLLFDFGVNTTGVCRLKYKGQPGQKITLRHGEALVGDTFYNRNIYTPSFDGNLAQTDILICSGNEDVFEPRFTFHGFRYVFVEGVYPYDVAEDFLVLCQLSSDLKESGSFTCSDEVVNRLQEITVNSDKSNFIYFPMDCPQREKNGWTADAALSAEQMLLNLDCANSLTVWLDNIREAQKESGQIPAIVPTCNFGYEWGSGPAWDYVLIELPYQIYRYTGNQQVLLDNKDAIFHYLQYLKTKRNENGLLGYGLCDWCETGKFSEGDADTPVEVTDTLVSIDMLRKSEFIFELVNEPERVNDCKSFREQLTTDFKKKYLGNDLMISCQTQTAQAKAIEVGLFTDAEKPQAVHRLVDLIERDNNCFKVGVIGARVLFRVLAENGYAELAYKLITQDGFPSYKYWLDHGATSLWEAFHEVKEDSLLRKDGGRMLSLNHHFWGDISAWFYRYVLGIRVNPNDTDADYIEIHPCEIHSISYAEGTYENKNGSISVTWNRSEQGNLNIQVSTTGNIRYAVKEDVQ